MLARNIKLKILFPLLIFFFLLSAGLSGAEPVKNIESLLGKNFREVFQKIGYPEHIFSVRQKKPADDDVVMVYNFEDEYFYLYFYNNNFYRVLIPSTFKGNFYNIKIGSSLKDVKFIFGSNIKKEGEDYYYELKDKVYSFKIKQNKVQNIWLIKQPGAK
jgi:hypothetical protein